MKNKLFLSAILGLIGLLGLYQFQAKDMGVCTFDQGQILRSFSQQLISHEMSDKKAKAKTRQFAASLKKSLDDYAKSRHVIVIDKNKVLASGGCDVTQAVISLVSKNMRGRV